MCVNGCRNYKCGINQSSVGRMSKFAPNMNMNTFAMLICDQIHIYSHDSIWDRIQISVKDEYSYFPKE